MDKLLFKKEEMQNVPDFRFLSDLYGKDRHAAGWRDEQKVSGGVSTQAGKRGESAPGKGST